MLPAIKNLLAVLATQVVGAAGLAIFWEQAQQNPLVTAAIGVVYEASILFFGFGGRVSKRIWDQLDLEKRIANSCVAWIEAQIAGFDPRFAGRYRRALLIHHESLNARGLGLINTFSLKLEHVFVDLRITPSANLTKPNFDPIAVRELANPQQIWALLRSKTALRDGVALTIIGPPGSGRSTLLQHVALTLAARHHRRHHSWGYFPILLAIREHAAAILANPNQTFGQIADLHFANRAPFPNLSPRPGWFEHRLQRGGCLILLDGLDEIADADQRRDVSSWVDRQIQHYVDCRFVVAARPQGYRDAPLERANVVEVLPFTAEQVRNFIERWYLANETYASGGKQDTAVRYRAIKGATDLLDRLRATPALADLTINPLLLTMIAMVHKYHDSLPGSRVQLYADICQVLLDRWRQARDIQETLRAEQKLVVLRPLAARMMALKTREIKLPDALAIIREPLGRVPWGDREPELFLREIQSGSGLLLEREEGIWSFAHLSFQEFLTAMHWRQTSTPTPDWSSLVEESWWHETCRLYAAQADATSVLAACLHAGSIPALALAAECLEEAGEIDARTRAAVEARIVADLESRNQERRRLAAEVQLTRRLNKLQRIDDDLEIDLEYLTCAEYQLFLDDLRTREEYRQPDHWTAISFQFGKAREPIAGVRPEDASAFCGWLAERRGGQMLFRLPRPEEATAYPTLSNHLAAWCRVSTPTAFLTTLDPGVHSRNVRTSRRSRTA